jgi:hypothetical protein
LTYARQDNQKPSAFIALSISFETSVSGTGSAPDE